MIELIALIREMTGLLVTDVWTRYMHHGMYWMLHCFFYGFSWTNYCEVFIRILCSNGHKIGMGFPIQIIVTSCLFGYCARSSTGLIIMKFFKYAHLDVLGITCIMQCIGCCIVSFIECFGIYKFQETRHMSRQFLKYAHLNALIDVFLENCGDILA